MALFIIFSNWSEYSGCYNQMTVLFYLLKGKLTNIKEHVLHMSHSEASTIYMEKISKKY